jgi:Ca-activated chloride channel homolog
MIWPDLSQLHFIRPLWLYGIPALLALWLLLSRLRNVTLWEEFIPKDKLEVLQVNRGRHSKSWRRLLMLGWLVGVIGASGPSWRQVEVPTVRNESAMVIVLDLSQSMLAQDLTPDRLSRAKYKLIDLLRSRADGQTALVVYAGDAHTVAPLTDDAATIEVLLPALHPAIMPIAGSNAEAALELAQQLMRDAGISGGKIIMLTDGITEQARNTIEDEVNSAYSLSILGVGTSEPVPIPDQRGGFVRDSRGEIVLVGVNRSALSDLAQTMGGRYVDIQTDNSDVLALSESSDLISDTGESSLVYDSWEDIGYWLILLMLPFAAFSFRKGVFFLVPLGVITLAASVSPHQAYAQEQDESGGTSFTENLWKTADQRGAELYEQGESQAAASTFDRPDWAAVANYRAGNFEQAAETFNQLDGAEAQYNLGNSLAFAGQLEQAIEAYDKALEASPEMEDAQHNKVVVEQLLEQQESQEQQEQDEQDQSESEQDSSDENSSEEQNQDSGQPQDQDPDQQNEGSQDQTDPNEDSQNEDSEPQETPEDDADEPTEEESEQQEPDSQEGQEEQDQQEASVAAEPTPEELDESSERWLRGIPDDPSGFLRRKFEYESARAQQEQRLTPNNQTLDDERY